MTISKQHTCILLLLLLCSYSTNAAAKHNTVVACLPDQASSLLQLKNSFVDADGNLASWREGRDCCHWEGVTCDMVSGRVVSLDLGEFNLESRSLDPALFNLTSLRNLSLAFNDFSDIILPSYGFERLTNIIHLNFSYTNFYGQIPTGIAFLKNLVTFDFSDNYGLYLQQPNFQTFMANLSSLRELRLDGVHISSAGSTWSVVLASSAPQLQILSLQYYGLTGPIHPSFSRLRSLMVIRLGYNSLTGEVPEYFTEFSSLRVLDISFCSFDGQFPTKIFGIKTLRTLDLSYNDDLSVCLPDFLGGSDLQELNLAGSNLSTDVPPTFTNLVHLKTLGLSTSGILKWYSLINKLPSLNELQLHALGSGKPVLSWIGYLKRLTSLQLEGYDFSKSTLSWIGNLTSLANLEMFDCIFSTPIPYQIGNFVNMRRLVLTECNNNRQPIPSWIGNLTKLTALVLYSCNFSGSVPSTIGNLTQLEIFDGANNKLFGKIPEYLSVLSSLQTFDVSFNQISGKIPKSLLTLPVLQILDLSFNQISGLEDTSTILSSPISSISLYANHITGPIPKSFFQLKHLKLLDLSSNRFSGTIELSSFWKLKKLYSLSLSNNMLSVVEEESGSVFPSFPNIKYLGLASCNLKKLPDALRYLDNITRLDLSTDNITGVIPSWIWAKPLISLNLSGNMFTYLEESHFLVHMPHLDLLDLSFNGLQGTIPIPLTMTNQLVLDYSNNIFSFIIPNFGRYITNTVYLDLSENKLNCHIPSSICSASQLDIIDLSYNNFIGAIPSCLIESGNLNVLKLRENQLHGMLPTNIAEGCKFKTIDLSGNQLEGKLPKSLSNCQDLELFDVGNNRITGSFPSWLGALPSLRVLVLKSNQLNGTIEDSYEDPSTSTHFTSIQVLDLASNNFSGILPEGWFRQLKAMMTTDNDNGQILGHYTNSVNEFYQDTITITLKGVDRILTKIFMAFKVIDLSNNSFDGPIPESLGQLVSLHGLNMSYNNFTGQIPRQLSILSRLESLDLSSNQLSGEIPSELTSLTSLGWLNISHNNLTGRIPQGNQFSTFPESSFEDNAGLCGIPLSKPCEDQGSIAPTVDDPSDPNNMWRDKLGVIVLFALVGLGFGVGFALSFLLRLFCHVEWWVCKYP